MAIIKQEGVKEVGTYILAPKMSCRFRVQIIINDNCSHQTLTDSIINFSYSVCDSICQITIEDPLCTNSIHHELSRICNSPSCLLIEFMNGQGAIESSLRLNKLKMISHDFKLDYGSPDIAKHYIKFSFNDITATHTKDGQEQIIED